MSNLSKKIMGISFSATLALNAKAKEMKAQGVEVLNFAVGEPDFSTEKFICDAAKQSIDEGFTKYTAASGVMDLREAISEKFSKDNQINYDPSEIVVGSGAKPLLYAALVAMCDPGDEVILAAPYWVSYIELIKLADAVPVIVETEETEGFEMKADSIKEKITDKTKVIILNSPSNPTGGVISESEQRKIAELAVEKDLFIISDEIYEKLLYEGEHFSIASINEDLKSRTVTINGASKAYAMTGWRIGYCGASKEIAKAMGNFLSHVTGNPCSIAQKAFLAALKGDQTFVHEMKDEFKQRRDLFIDGLNSIDGISCQKPAGAFYLYPNFSALFNDERADSLKMAEYLLENLHIAAVPGAAFGTNEHIRFSYAASIDNINECLKRLREKL